MKKNLIYEMKYPHVDYTKEYEHDKANFEKDSQEEKTTLGGIMKGIHVNTQYTPIPKRLEESEEFIEEAIKVSKLYHADIRIIESDAKISVYLSFDFWVEMKYASCLFGMTDKISFFKDSNEHDVTVCLDFYTHVVARSGLAIAP